MLDQCWARVCDAGPTLIQHRIRSNVHQIQLSREISNPMFFNPFIANHGFSRFSCVLFTDQITVLGIKCLFKHVKIQDLQMFGLKLNKY